MLASTLTLALVLDARAADSAATAGATAVPAGWPTDPEVAAVYRALSVRDPVPSCASVEALASEPTKTLLEIVQVAQMPPWAGIRAANCLVEGHAVELQSTLQAWVADPGTKGLAIVVMGSLDRMPVSVSVPVAQAALAGPMADLLRPKVEVAVAPEVRALVGR